MPFSASECVEFVWHLLATALRQSNRAAEGRIGAAADLSPCLGSFSFQRDYESAVVRDGANAVQL